MYIWYNFSLGIYYFFIFIFFFFFFFCLFFFFFFFFQAEDGIRDRNVTGVQTCALPIFRDLLGGRGRGRRLAGRRRIHSRRAWLRRPLVVPARAAAPSRAARGGADRKSVV